MKFLLISYYMLLSFVTLAQQAQYKSQEQVQQTIINVFEALSNRDETSLRNNCTADVRFYEYGESWTVDTLIHRAITKNTATDFKRTNKFDFINTTIKGDIAWATYNLNSTITSNGKEHLVSWNETVILLQNKKQWRLTVLQSTRVGK